MTTFSWKYFDVDDHVCKSYAPATWRDTFIADYEAYLIDMGWLTETHLWTTAFHDRVADEHLGAVFVRNSSFVFAQWVDPDQLCDVIVLLDSLFGTSLCETNFTSSFGTLQSLCPLQCGVCDDVAGVSSARLVWIQDIFSEQTALLNASAINHAIIVKTDAYTLLTCDSWRTYSTIGGNVFKDYDSPERWLVFYSERNQTVVFSTCDGSEFNTIIHVFTSWWSWINTNDDNRLCEDGVSSRLHLDAQAGWRYVIVVHGKGKSQQGTFGISTECCVENDDQCSYKESPYYWRTSVTEYTIYGDYYRRKFLDFDYLDSLFQESN